MVRLLGRMLGAIVPICRADPLLDRPRRRTVEVSARNSSWFMRVKFPSHGPRIDQRSPLLTCRPSRNTTRVPVVLAVANEMGEADR